MCIEINGIGGLFAQMVLFRPMMSIIGPKMTITFAISVNMIFFIVYAAGASVALRHLSCHLYL